MRGTWLCEFCEPMVPRLDAGICFRCGGPANRSCSLCRQLDPSIALARSAYPYTGWVSRAVRSFKYAEEWDRGRSLADLLAPAVQAFGPIDGIVPVPLHPARLRRRGYNQAAILAEGLADSLGVPVMPLLVRARETKPQVELGREDRHTNVRHAFSLDSAWAPEAGGRFLLVDDVRTTGATVNACARELMGIGPAAIYAATLALDLPDAILRSWMDEHAPG